MILNEHENIVDIADMINEDVYGAILSLVNSGIHDRELNWDKAMLPLFSCYINKVYVYPNYRGEGIGRYIFENLEQIFMHCFNTQIHSFVIYPKPQQPDEAGNWLGCPDDSGYMLSKMVVIIEINGYAPLGNSGYYAINCATDN